MVYKLNDKNINIPDEEIENLIDKLELTEQEAIQTWLEDNDYIKNEEVENLTKKAKENKTNLPKARKNVENKKTTRERKENTTKAEIIKYLFENLSKIQDISALKIENKEKIITFELNNNSYKLDLIQKRKK